MIQDRIVLYTGVLHVVIIFVILFILSDLLPSTEHRAPSGGSRHPSRRARTEYMSGTAGPSPATTHSSGARCTTNGKHP